MTCELCYATQLYSAIGQVLVLRHLPDIDLSAFIDAWLGTARPGGPCRVTISPHITSDGD